MVPARMSRLTHVAASAVVMPVLLTLAAVIVIMFGGGVAAAESPARLPEPLSDPANVLSDAQRTEIDRAADQLLSEHGVQLWVVFTKTFGNQTATAWADETAKLSDLGGHDVLLAVATDSRSYHLVAPDSYDGLTQSDLESIAADNILPALRRNEWTQAAVGAAQGLDDALEPSHTGAIVAGTVGGVAVLGAGGVWVYSRRRKRARITAGVESLREQELTAEQLAAAPLDVLDPWSREVLTDTDNAIRTSEEELRLAVDEFGTPSTAPFAAAVAAAQRSLRTSFTLRQRLDDDIPETPDEQRSLLVEIITTCSDADQVLDEQVAAFDEMRNLLINADTRFDEITRQLVDLRTRVEASSGQLAALVAAHGAQTCHSLLHNVDLARQEVEFAERSADQGRAAIARPAGQQGPAVADIRAAEGAIAQAGKLLDAIANAEANIAAAHTQMPMLIAEVESELAEAATLDADGGPALAGAVTGASAALADAKTSADSDPLGVFTALVAADALLDEALASARGAAAERRRRADILTAALTSARAKVSAASDFIDTRRGAVQSEARTRLSEAQRLLQAATDSATDPPLATESARRAGTLADEALMSAQGDVVSWQSRHQPQSSAGSAAGAVLGGILVDSFLRGTMRGGGIGGFPGGGYTSGGRSPGSFGGSSSSGRIGTGGRF